MDGIPFVTGDKGRKTAVLIDFKKHGAAVQDLWDGLIAESRRNEKDVPCDEVRKALVKRQPGGLAGG